MSGQHATRLVIDGARLSPSESVPFVDGRDGLCVVAFVATVFGVEHDSCVWVAGAPVARRWAPATGYDFGVRLFVRSAGGVVVVRIYDVAVVFAQGRECRAHLG